MKQSQQDKQGNSTKNWRDEIYGKYYAALHRTITTATNLIREECENIKWNLKRLKSEGTIALLTCASMHTHKGRWCCVLLSLPRCCYTSDTCTLSGILQRHTYACTWKGTLCEDTSTMQGSLSSQLSICIQLYNTLFWCPTQCPDFRYAATVLALPFSCPPFLVNVYGSMLSTWRPEAEWAVFPDNPV